MASQVENKGWREREIELLGRLHDEQEKVAELREENKKLRDLIRRLNLEETK